jgi:phosphatidylserine/phosphatidylglycerophosphate/cardiolipin synthase-like enzyme
MKISCFLFCLFSCLAAHAESLPASASYELSFSPNGKALSLVLNTINSAQKEILVAAYSFTSKPISKALVGAHQRGVSVRVVADEKENGERYTAVHFLANQGVPVRLNSNYAIMHNKFMVIDGSTVETGSFNYSAAAASKNAENVLVIKNAATLATRYAEEWQRLWDEGTDLAKAY